MNQLLLEHGQGRAFARVLLGLGHAATVLLLSTAPAWGQSRSAPAINLKFSEALRVGVTPGGLRTGAGELLPRVEQVLRAHGNPAVSRLFSTVPLARLESLQGAARARALRPAPSLAAWHRLRLAPASDPARLIAELNGLAEVDTAYLAPQPAPPPGGRLAPEAHEATPDFSSRQTYLGPAPAGIDAIFARTQPGGAGGEIAVVDIEYDWFLDHEDLQLGGARLGGACDPFCGDDHGTSVLGVLGGRANGLGVTGGAPGASIRVLSPIDEGTHGYNLPGAIVAAGALLGPGDVLLLEQQAVGPAGGVHFVPAEWDPAVFDAVRVLTQAGIIVVEAAGNGGEDLDAPEFGGRFDRARFESGAVIVGAGDSNRVRLEFSSYGSRLDLQGWGCCVVTTGYGDLFGSARSTFYTSRFTGTSSAAAIAAAAAAAVQGYAKAALGAALAPDRLVDLLRRTGTPQTGGAAQRIGPLPNVRAALLELGAQPQRARLTVAAAGDGGGTVTSAPGGIDCALGGAGGSACGEDFELGTTVTLSATPAEGSKFTGWSGDCSGTEACRVTIAAARAVTATFELESYRLEVAAAGAGSGGVTSQTGLAPAIDCTARAGAAAGDCGATYPHGAVVILTATPAGNSGFGGWSGACTGTGACRITMNRARMVSAAFTLQPVTLSVAAAGTGSGTVTSSPDGVDCAAAAGTVSGKCESAFAAGTEVTLTAAATGGSSFAGWEGGCSGGAPCVVTLDQARAVTATFALDQLTLSVAGAGDGDGAVTSSPAGIDCAITAGVPLATCEAVYAHGTEVTLAATPAAGSEFAGWSGGCSGTGGCTVAMDQARSVTAGFGRSVAVLTIGGAGVGSGTVTTGPGTPVALECRIADGVPGGAGCRAELAVGSRVSLIAAPSPGSLFTGWSGPGVNCGAAAACTVAIDGATAVAVRFIAEPPAGVAAGEFLGSPRLTAEQKTGLDLAGNRNGRFDVGDYLAMLDRAERRQ